MNAFTMKLESRQHFSASNEDKSTDFIYQKKSKSLNNISSDSDKSDLFNNHGLGRKFIDKTDLNSINVSNSLKRNNCKKVRPNKVDRMLAENNKMQENLQRFLSTEDKEKILCILNEIRTLSDIEKLYLYLQLPTGSPFEVDPFKQRSLNPLGKKADEEGMFAITWIQSHLEEDLDVSLPKQEIYDEYRLYCNLSDTDPLCAADFGKVMKQIFPSVKPRRLGTRGNSRYCYSGLRKKLKLVPPSVPDVQNEKENLSDENISDEVTAAACHLLFEWAEKLLGIQFSSLRELASHLLENMYVDNRSVAAFTVLLDSSPQLMGKGFPPTEGSVKKSEAQFHLQRKIQEKELIKEQKKKLQEQRTHIASAVSRGKGAFHKKKSQKSRRTKLLSPEGSEFECNKNSKNTGVKMDGENVPVSSFNAELNIKKEDCLPKSDASSSPLPNLLLSSPSSSSGDAADSTKQKSPLIPRSKTPPVCIAQSLPGILIVPSLPQLATDIGKQTLPKYKRIQPKPLQGEVFSTVARSRTGSVGSSLPSKPKAHNGDGRRSSHAWLQSDTFVSEENSLKNNSANTRTSCRCLRDKNATRRNSLSLKDSICFETPHNQSISEDINSENLNTVAKLSCEKKKRVPALQMESILSSNLSAEVEDNNPIKRHLDEKDDHADNKRVHLDKTSWMAGTISKESSQKYSRMGHEEVNVHEIEGDALNDYFRGAANTSMTSLQESELDQQLSSTNKVQQLSQLRMLLEQNLPSSAISKGSTSFSKISKSVDEIIQSDLEGGKIFIPVCANNVFFENPSNVCGSPSVKADSLERLLSSSHLAPSGDNQLLTDPSLFINCPQANIQDIAQNGSTLLSDSSESKTNVTQSGGRVSTCTQVPSVPQSPNTRRRAFNFMPISPRHTPIPEGLGTNGTSSLSSPHLRTMMSTAVGPSQPPSNSGSPFVSPRSTPVPLCRSRHSSGQSTYSTSRHTPFQNFDSGVSSVSSSPFISPQPTPVPVSRLRHNSSKSVTFSSLNGPQIIHNQPHLRTRHSSGPGASLATASSLLPLVSEQSSAPSFMFTSGNEIRSRHNSGSNTTTPLSPVSEQASSSSSCTSNIPDLLSVNDVPFSVSQSFLNDGAADLLISGNPSSSKQVRHRHASSSAIYGKPSLTAGDIFSQEIQKLLKNCQENGSSDISLSNRSQSVPLHQMLQTTDGYCLLTQPIEDSSTKSHPSTPVMNQLFSFPVLNSNQEASSLALSMDKSQMEWSTLDSPIALEANSARRNLSTLYDTVPLGDDLQTTLEDLRDCDTDFSKLELELRQNEESGL